MTTRKEALVRIREMQKRGFYKKFKEEPIHLLGKKIYFCTIYNVGDLSLEEYKKLARRLFNGEEIIMNTKPVTMVFGLGKLLGTIKTKDTCLRKIKQYVLYNTIILEGKDRSSSYDVFHETWTRLGEWVRSYGLTVIKEKVVFT